MNMAIIFLSRNVIILMVEFGIISLNHVVMEYVMILISVQVLLPLQRLMQMGAVMIN